MDTKPAGKGAVKATLRNEAYAAKQNTKIWYEEPSSSNQYVAKQAFCHGYNLTDLLASRTFIEVVYLLFKGELPERGHAQLLDRAFIALANPGPRHPATRAAVQAAVGKTQFAQVLPIAMTVMGGSYAAAGEVESAMRFVLKHRSEPVQAAISACAEQPEGWRNPGVIPGFGAAYNGIDELTVSLLNDFAEHESAGECICWARAFSDALQQHGMAVLPTGLAAAIFCDLGFSAKAGIGLYQLLSAPGLLAHGLEYANKPRTAIPFVTDENYVIEDE